MASSVEHDYGKGVAGFALIDCHTGAILTLASTPGYKLEDLRTRYHELDQTRGKPLLDYATMPDQMPGSVMKICTALACLEYGVLTPGEIIFCGDAMGHTRARREDPLRARRRGRRLRPADRDPAQLERLLRDHRPPPGRRAPGRLRLAVRARPQQRAGRQRPAPGLPAAALDHRPRPPAGAALGAQRRLALRHRAVPHLRAHPGGGAGRRGRERRAHRAPLPGRPRRAAGSRRPAHPQGLPRRGPPRHGDGHRQRAALDRQVAGPRGRGRRAARSPPRPAPASAAVPRPAATGPRRTTPG